MEAGCCRMSESRLRRWRVTPSARLAAAARFIVRVADKYRHSVNARCLGDLDELLANNEIWFVSGRADWPQAGKDESKFHEFYFEFHQSKLLPNANT